METECPSCHWFHRGKCLAQTSNARQFVLHGDPGDPADDDGEIEALGEHEISAKEVTLEECKGILMGDVDSEGEESEPDYDSQITYDE